MNKAINIRLTAVAKKVLATQSRNSAGPGNMIEAAKVAEQNYKPKLHADPHALRWLKKKVVAKKKVVSKIRF